MIEKLKKYRLPPNRTILDIFLESILGFTKRLARNLQFFFFFKVLRRKAQSYTQRFANLRGIDNELKTKLLAQLRNFEIKFSVSDIWENVISFPFLAVYILISFISIIGAPYWAVNIAFNGSFTTFSSTFIGLAIVLGFLNLLLVPVLLIFLTEITPTREVNLSLPILLLILLALILWLRSNELGPVPPSIRFLIISSLVFQASFLVGLAIALVGYTLGRIISLRLVRRFYPETFIVHELVRIIAELDCESKSWMSVGFRHQIIYSIEGISSCVERDLSRALRSGDKATDLWLRKTTSRIASALRQKKKWLLTPKVDTQVYLYNYLVDYLIQLVSGDWDSLEQEEPIVVSVKQIWVEQVGNVFRVLFVGGTPIILLWLIQNSRLALNAPFDDYAIIGTLLWAIFTAITTYDPLFSAKISAVKDVINLVPFIGKKP